jgi:hypothetical protein
MTESFDIIDAHVALGEEHHFRLDSPDLLQCMDAHGIAIARPTGGELAVHNRRGPLAKRGAVAEVVGVRGFVRAGSVSEGKQNRSLTLPARMAEQVL